VEFSAQVGTAGTRNKVSGVFMKYIFSLIILAFLFGCSNMPETRYFTLSHQSAENQAVSSDKVLIVKQFKSEPIYQQEKFVYRPSEYEVKFDHYRRWVQSPPQILTSRLIEYLKGRNDFKFVSSEIHRNEGYFQLDCKLIQFEEIISGSKRNATVGINYKLVKMPQGKMLACGSLTKIEMISGTDAEDIVKALSIAIFNIFNELAVIIQE
jgi:ABC-type uncharacterized transport system auxiliary subunit